MNDDMQAAMAANALQADYFAHLLDQERGESAARLAALTRRLTKCMTEGDLRFVGHVRGLIRHAEKELQEIEQMIDDLKARFGESGDQLRRA